MKKIYTIMTASIILLLCLGLFLVPALVESGQRTIQLTAQSPLQPTASPPPANPEMVLWDQYSNWSSTDFAAQDFEPSYDTYDIYAGDDFENGQPWLMQTITMRGGWSGYVDLSNATAIHWYIYENVGGEPAGVPGDGSEYWSISFPPSDPHVQLGVNEPEDVVLTLDPPVFLPPGVWSLVYFVSLEFGTYGQYGWSGTLNPPWGNVGVQNNPGGGFGLPPGWNDNSYGYDFMFRLEGELGIPWDFCFYDENYYVTELWISLYGTVIHGQAFCDSPEFPAPITGKAYNGKAFFSIAYLNNNLRFYMVDLPTRSGTTWGVYPSGEFYDYPHAAQFMPCGSLAKAGEPRSGALE